MSYLISLQKRAFCYVSVMMLYLKVASAFSFTLRSHMQLCRRRKWQPTPVFLLGESFGQRSLAGYCPQGCTESGTTEALQYACTHWRRQWQPTPVFLPGESQGQRTLVGCHLWGRTKLDTTKVTQQQQQHAAFQPEPFKTEQANNDLRVCWLKKKKFHPRF